MERGIMRQTLLGVLATSILATLANGEIFGIIDTTDSD